MGNVFSDLMSAACGVVFSRCLDCTLRRTAYVTDLQVNVSALANDFQKLTEVSDDVRMRVVNAERRQMQRLNQVQGWLSRVQAEEYEVRMLLRVSSGELERLRLGGYCSMNCMSSYEFGKKVAEKLEAVQTLLAQGDFPTVAESLPEAVVDERPIESTIVGLQPLFNKVLRYLGEERVGIVGIYGMGGIGKTTLLTQINNSFVDAPCDFDVVIWVVVSKDLQIESIQEQIARKINLFSDNWKNRSLEEKASDIFKILRKKKFVLLLDDLWEHVDLIKVGVPSPNSKNASKLAFTTREFEVCGNMAAHKCVQVECLGIDDAWELFQEKVGRGVLDSHPEIPELAKIITEECGGLPLALITVGRAMASKRSPQEWKHAIEVLRTSASNISGMEKKVYSRLKFSYDNLHDQMDRSCFLHCCLFPEDYNINKEDLIDCWIGEGFLDEYSGDSTRNHGHSIIGILVGACLLEERDGCVKMHDVTRDMAIWIACNIEKEKERFLVLTGVGLINAPKVGLWEDVKRLSLINNKIEELLETPTCPHLQTLFLNRNNIHRITDNFFQFMPSLKVLNLSNNHSLTRLPSGISKLVSLQHLDLSSTRLKELTIELKALVNLKYLGLDNALHLEVIPPQLISNFSRLQILRMFCCSIYVSNIIAEGNVLFGGGELLVEELICLKHLNVLTITLRSCHALQQLLRSPHLQSRTKSLELVQFDDVKSFNVLSLAKFNHLQELSVRLCDNLALLKIDDIGEVQKAREPGAFHGLLRVVFIQCFKLRDLTWLVFVPNLEHLNVEICGKLEEIISFGKLGDDPDIMAIINPFAKIRFLHISSCGNLKSIYLKALPFPHLEKITVLGCPKLRKLPLDSNSAKERKIVIVGEKDWWKKLQWEDDDTQNAFLPCFKEFKF